MGIQPKKKLCKGPCGEVTYIWARGCCRKCSSKASPNKIAPVSDKRKQEQKSYTVMRKLFLDANPECACGGKIPGCDGMATTIHHKIGRLGELYLDVRHWAGLSMSCHVFVEMNPLWAKENGLSENRL